MSANRLFQMVYLLLEHGRLTAQELSEKLEVSLRTVYRDVDSLSAAGVPICAAQGKGGGVYLMEGYVLDRAAFTEEEQRQLLTALRALPGEESDAALQKLSALFRREEEDWLQVNLSRWGDSAWDNESFRALRRAIHLRHTVTFRYASSRGEILPREVLPAKLVFKGQGWYLQAYDPLREDYRTFRLTRMLDLAVTERSFHRQLTPPDIDFAGEIPPLFRADCLLRFAPGLAYRVYDEFSRDCIRTLPDGRLEVRVSFPEDDWLTGYLLSFGAGVEVLSPARLRRKLAALGQEIFAAHAKPDRGCQVSCDTMETTKKEEVSPMDPNTMKFCQSCGMPMLPGIAYGTEADGAPNPDYCSYCYDKGHFLGEMTMDEMIDFCAGPMARNNPGMTVEQAKEHMHQFFPKLKRWKK